MEIRAYLACSFDDCDMDIVDLFISICNGLGINCINVNIGCSPTPPEKACELIENAHMFIAIATRKTEVSPGKFIMPQAVDEEMSMAFAKNKPILLFAEDGIDTGSGFVKNYCTYSKFDRGALHSLEFLKKAIKSIHELKLLTIQPHELELAQHGQGNVYAESCRCLTELIYQSGSFTWRYTQSRSLRFTSRFNDPIRAAAWAAIPPNEDVPAKVFKWSYDIRNGSKQFGITPIVEKMTNDFCEISFSISPKPENGDFFEFIDVFESPYLNPVYLEDIPESHPNVIIDGIVYACYDGVIPIYRAQNFKAQFRFPVELGLKPADFVPYVGSFSTRIDYLVETEIERMKTSIESFGGNIIVDLTIQSPLLQHIYGIAWNPPKKPRSEEDTLKECCP
jgi:hypothetical protein